ncbi:MAG: hypothetical protein NC037_06515 [Bacteroides sp.]|nr:hypothetical protein [Bacillota bacterium]MCM1456157.1 hypothetical protein [Bacteroides sp.]
MYYFGTDGIRDKAARLLERGLPYLLGKALSERGGKIIVARDVRTHSEDIEKQLCKGLLTGASQIWLTGILPTPALAYIAEREGADYAVMITASHNPPEFNGLKVFGKNGNKLPLADEIALDNRLREIAIAENMIENGSELRNEVALLDSETENHTGLSNEVADNKSKIGNYSELNSEAAADGATLTDDELSSALSIKISKQNHRIRIVDGAEFIYKKHVRGMFPRFDGVKVHLDCAGGCFAKLAKSVFEELGAQVQAENDERDGETVNVNCGSTHIEALTSKVQKDEIGFAFDGDGDRCIAVVDGKPYDGDAILLALSTLYRIQGKLRKKFVVGTTLTNSRLQRELAFQNTALVRADVGDKYVLDMLRASSCFLGGEKSGHILMLDRASTGDGLITALTLLEVKKTIGSLPKFIPYPMLEFNVRAERPSEYLNSDEFKSKVALAEKDYGKKGRLIVRPSGTEPYIRIAYECFAKDCDLIFDGIKKIFL